MTFEGELGGVKLSCTLPTPERWEHHLLIELPRACETLSHASLGGGLGRHQFILNRSVTKGWVCDDPECDMRRYMWGVGLEPSHTLGLTTAVSMAKVRHAEAARARRRVHTLVTAGVGNAAAAGGRFPLDDPSPQVFVGTVNLIVLVGGWLTPSTLVSAVQSATEAKVAAFQRAGVATRFGEHATGTTINTVTVVNLFSTFRSSFAGLATLPGY